MAAQPPVGRVDSAARPLLSGRPCMHVVVSSPAVGIDRRTKLGEDVRSRNLQDRHGHRLFSVFRLRGRQPPCSVAAKPRRLRYGGHTRMLAGPICGRPLAEPIVPGVLPGPWPSIPPARAPCMQPQCVVNAAPGVIHGDGGTVTDRVQAW
jgi:hypothetical protein